MSPILTVTLRPAAQPDGQRQPLQHGPVGPPERRRWLAARQSDRDQWFNTAAFVANDRYTFGNAPRNMLRGPGTFNVDVALRKSFPLTARPRRSATRIVQRHQQGAPR